MNFLISHKDKFLCEKNRNKVGFISVPHYFIRNSDFSDISIFVTLLMGGILNENYETCTTRDDFFWQEKFETYFLPESLKQIDEETYIFDLDDFLTFINDDERDRILINLEKMPSCLVWIKREELKKINIAIDDYDYVENKSYRFSTIETYYDENLIEVEKIISQPRSDLDVLLLYSGGKDSTLSAIKLREMGYNPYFIHFNNGSMLDSDKPFLTFKNSFKDFEGYFFPYEYSDVDIKVLFKSYYEHWESHNHNPRLTSEIRCLSCRMAMYTQAFEIAIKNNFRIISEGARISQEFFIEQEKFLSKIVEITNLLNIKLIFPVLKLESDSDLISSLIKSGFSSKSWESKCLLGEEAVDKTEKDEQVITDYYNNYIRPKILQNLNI